MRYDILKGNEVGLTIWETKGVIKKSVAVAEFQVT